MLLAELLKDFKDFEYEIVAGSIDTDGPFPILGLDRSEVQRDFNTLVADKADIGGIIFRTGDVIVRDIIDLVSHI